MCDSHSSPWMENARYEYWASSPCDALRDDRSLFPSLSMAERPTILRADMLHELLNIAFASAPDLIHIVPLSEGRRCRRVGARGHGRGAAAQERSAARRWRSDRWSLGFPSARVCDGLDGRRRMSTSALWLGFLGQGSSSAIGSSNKIGTLDRVGSAIGSDRQRKLGGYDNEAGRALTSKQEAMLWIVGVLDCDDQCRAQ